MSTLLGSLQKGAGECIPSSLPVQADPNYLRGSKWALFLHRLKHTGRRGAGPCNLVSPVLPYTARPEGQPWSPIKVSSVYQTVSVECPPPQKGRAAPGAASEPGPVQSLVPEGTKGWWVVAGGASQMSVGSGCCLGATEELGHLTWGENDHVF